MSAADMMGCAPGDLAAQALASLLEAMEARVPGGMAADRVLKLRKVWAQWPTTYDVRDLPDACVTEATAASDVWQPQVWEAPLDELAAELGDHSGELQVDIWATNPVELRALKAAFVAQFGARRLEDEGSGESVLLPVPEAELPATLRGRLSLQVRLTLDGPPRDMVEALGARREELRATARVAWDAQAVRVLEAERVDVIVASGNITEPDGLDEQLDQEV